MTIKDLLMFVLGLVAGVSLHFGITYQPAPERTCETAQRENLALEQCLRYRPSCTSVEVSDFERYHSNKDWIAEHCPATDSGDGFLSQDNR